MEYKEAEVEIEEGKDLEIRLYDGKTGMVIFSRIEGKAKLFTSMLRPGIHYCDIAGSSLLHIKITITPKE